MKNHDIIKEENKFLQSQGCVTNVKNSREARNYQQDVKIAYKRGKKA